MNHTHWKRILKQEKQFNTDWNKRWTNERHTLMLLWFEDLMNVTEVTIHRPVSTLLSSAFIRGDLHAATRGPFTWSLN